MEQQPIKAIVLLSGGLDSCVVLASAIASNRTCSALSFNYGQRHQQELLHAQAIAAHYGVPHSILTIDASLFSEGPSSLTNTAISIRSGTTSHPSTYVPCRNLLFFAHAASMAESQQASEIWIGANANDAPSYPDCRPSFFKAFEQTVVEGSFLTSDRFKIVSPLVHLDKRQIIALGRQLKAPIDCTWSCYDPRDGKPCHSCAACTLRASAEKN